jgi:hypothetical protein
MDFSDMIERMMDARDAYKADPSEENREAYQEAKNAVSAMYDEVRDRIDSMRDSERYKGF